MKIGLVFSLIDNKSQEEEKRSNRTWSEKGQRPPQNRLLSFQPISTNPNSLIFPFKTNQQPHPIPKIRKKHLLVVKVLSTAVVQLELDRHALHFEVQLTLFGAHGQQGVY